MLQPEVKHHLRLAQRRHQACTWRMLSRQVARCAMMQLDSLRWLINSSLDYVFSSSAGPRSAAGTAGRSAAAPTRIGGVHMQRDVPAALL